MKTTINAIKIILAIALMSPAIMLFYDIFAQLMFLPQFADWRGMTRSDAFGRVFITVVWTFFAIIPTAVLIKSIEE